MLMTAIVARAEVLDLTNPKLVFIHATRGPTDFTAGKLADIEVSLEYQVFDISTDEKRTVPVQVFPATPGLKQSVNLVTDRLGKGRYAAVGWTVDANAPVGRYEIRWFYTFQAGDAERSEPAASSLARRTAARRTCATRACAARPTRSCWAASSWRRATSRR
jgi:hypothetical protein